MIAEWMLALKMCNPPKLLSVNQGMLRSSVYDRKDYCSYRRRIVIGQHKTVAVTEGLLSVNIGL